MKKENWIQKEIDQWKEESIITDDVAITLKQRYMLKRNNSFLIVLFSIIGALLIGTGIILIFAKNWYILPMFLKVTLAFLPLVISQALAVYTLKFKYDSIAWREAVSILVTASIFTVVAMVGQIFHISGDFGTYVLTCGLLSLPMIFVLNVVSPLAIYYWTIINWASLDHVWGNAFILFGLYAIGVLLLFVKRKQDNASVVYTMWLTVVVGFVVALIMGIILKTSLLLVVIGYFVLLLSINNLSYKLLLPLKIIGTIGALITLAILTYRGMWNYNDDNMFTGAFVMLGCMLLAISFFAIKTWKADKLKFTFILTLALVCVARYVWVIAELDFWPYEFILMLISNVVMLLVGIGFIIHGTKNINLLITNAGMATTCTLIIMRFFDSDMDFLWRGIVFLILGIAFLLVNLKVLHMKKQNKQEVEV